jgi:uncharacterized membrane protein HdeD (DUF308 family)
VLRTLINNWWLVALRGIFALLFGAVVFFMKGVAHGFILEPMAFAGIVLLFGFLAVGAGMFTIVAALRSEKKNLRSWWLAADGLAASSLGVAVIVLPDLNVVTLAYMMAAWALVIGALEIVAAVHVRRHLPDEWMLALGAARSLAFGLYLLIRRPDEVQSLLLWMGWYAILSAVSMLGLAFRLRRLRRVSDFDPKAA